MKRTGCYFSIKIELFRDETDVFTLMHYRLRDVAMLQHRLLALQ